MMMEDELDGEIPHFTQYSININGLIAPDIREKKLALIQQFIKENKPDLIHFQETHFQSLGEAKAAFRRFGGEILGVTNASRRSRGVLTLVPPGSSVSGLIEEIDTDPYARWAYMRIATNLQSINIVNMYAPSASKAERERFFDQLADQFRDEDLIMVGDWNFISDQMDRVRIQGPVAQDQLAEDPNQAPIEPHPVSEAFLRERDLIDVFRYSYPDKLETSFRHRSGCVWKRLDRFYVQPALLDDCSVLPTISSPALSDHDFIGMSYLQPIKGEAPSEPFYRMSRYLIYLLGIKHSKFRKKIEDIISTHWEYANNPRYKHSYPTASSAYDAMKLCIKHTAISYDSNRKRRKAQIRKKASELVKFIDSSESPLPEQLAKKREAEESLRKLELQEVSSKKMRSQFNWIRDAEHSNKLFYQQIKTRESSTYLPDIKKNDNVSEGSAQKKQFVSEEYAQTFSKRVPEPQALNKALEALEQSGRVLPQEDIQAIKEFMEIDFPDISESDEEHGHRNDWLSTTLEGLKMYKAPGPDGIPNEFYFLLRHNCYLINFLKRVFVESLDSGKLPDSMRTTYYKLLYKKGYVSRRDIENDVLDGHQNDPKLLGNWRPIALLPCDSKVLSSYLASQLKHYVHTVIKPNQGAFVPGRSIHDNIMLMQQLLHRLNKSDGAAGVLFLDLAHAYDYISQDFIIKVLEIMKFPNIFIRAIKTMMAGQSGRCLVNGDLSPEFTVDNGGKQGDPLFPLIYIAANEALAALLETHPLYQGIKIPQSERRFKIVNYADDTAIGYGSALDADIVLNDILPVFEAASGNEIKKIKSFHILYNGANNWHRTVPTLSAYQTLLTGSSERYLGVKVGHSGVNPDWSRIVDKLKGTFESWRDQNITIAGRTLLLNSCLLAQVWFEVAQTPLPKNKADEISKAVNLYFRQGRKTTNISLETRLRAKSDGGLGQIDLATQTRLIQAKWAMRFHSGEDHLWTDLWALNVTELQEALKTDTHLLYLDYNWSRFRAHDSWDLFPLTAESYKAWHMLDFKLEDSNFNAVAAQPLFKNKYLLDDSDSSLEPTRLDIEVTENFCHLPVRGLFKEQTPYPTSPYSPQDPSTWVLIPMTPGELTAYYGYENLEDSWESILRKIPEHILVRMARGPDSLEGWAATELTVDGDIQVGDIYRTYVLKREGSDPPPFNLIHFFQPREGEEATFSHRTGEELVWESQSDPDQGDWEDWITDQDSLRTLAVSAVSGKAKALGWGDSTPSLHHFKVRGSDQSVEHMVAASYYNTLKEEPSSTNKRTFKPDFSSVNRKVRQLSSTPHPALQDWQPSDADITKHQEMINKGKRPAGSPCKMNWKEIFKMLWNCVYVHPKYKQLLYWVITNTIHTGSSVNRWNPGRGLCPTCQIPASKSHMFFTCTIIQDVWNYIDNIGYLAWPAYTMYKPNDPPHLLREYSPSNLLKLSTLWAIWTTWTTLFFQDRDEVPPLPPGAWYPIILNKAKAEFIKRIYEAAAMIQWIKLIADRRDTSPGADSPYSMLSEKEFLLVHSQSINANPEGITPDDGVVPPEYADWVGHGTLIKAEETLGRPRKLIFNHHEWPNQNLPPDVSVLHQPVAGLQPDFIIHNHNIQ